MSYSDIDIFLKSFGVDTQKQTSGSNSKWIYVKELLAETSEAVVLQIADELEIVHGHTVMGGAIQEDSRFWIPGFFRLFVSHLSEHKLKATGLKEALRKHAISCFVAHEDINPTLEWQGEIEKALASMDALAAILMPGFHDSKWTDQEIGFALGRGMLVVPLRHGLDPYGFIGKLQGVPCHGKTVAQVANSVFLALASNSLTKNKIATALVDQVVASPTPSTGTKFFNSLRQIETLSQSHLERLRDNLATNLRLASDAYFVKELNALLIEREIQPFEQPERALVPNDDLPF
ncbi:MAG: toll/interleukin-1 receptor domain-containing protein [Geobacteraceae bacterium]|nr:toll/interleukin-1 receptor domain-containing protein [Geobacteraceae bacterium]